MRRPYPAFPMDGLQPDQAFPETVPGPICEVPFFDSRVLDEPGGWSTRRRSDDRRRVDQPHAHHVASAFDHGAGAKEDNCSDVHIGTLIQGRGRPTHDVRL